MFVIVYILNVHYSTLLLILINGENKMIKQTITKDTYRQNVKYLAEALLHICQSRYEFDKWERTVEVIQAIENVVRENEDLDQKDRMYIYNCIAKHSGDENGEYIIEPNNQEGWNPKLTDLG